MKQPKKYITVSYNPYNYNDLATIDTSTIIGIKLSNLMIEMYTLEREHSLVSFYSTNKLALKEFKYLQKLMEQWSQYYETKNNYIQKLMIKNKYTEMEMPFSFRVLEDSENEEE
jgi:hypothetical protein